MSFVETHDSSPPSSNIGFSSMYNVIKFEDFFCAVGDSARPLQQLVKHDTHRLCDIAENIQREQSFKSRNWNCESN